MKVFVCNDHAGWWPVPTASVVVAEDEGRAYQLLKRKLKEDYNIDDDTFTLQELNTEKAHAVVLSHGDY